MKGKNAWSIFFLSLLALSILLSARGVVAQNIITGEITGTVTDPTGAVVPNATVSLSSKETGFNQTDTTNASGIFRFPLLRPGTYDISATGKGFKVYKSTAAAGLGAITEVPIQLSLGATTETVEVVGTAPLLQTENANITTTYTQEQIENLPNPGADLTNYALSAPGVVLSTGAGYGNFSANGLGGTANLYTINGGDMNDPYNNLNNSGSSNNMLGTNEVQEVALVSNGYTGQYGRMASVNMNITTKSGTNSFHGNADWAWNGRYLNANDWFNNATGTPKPFANSNTWGGSIGGPILKNKLFAFYDNEGLRYVLPGGGKVYLPTTQWAADVQANINATQGAIEQAFYTTMFSLYAGSPGEPRAVPLPVGGASVATASAGGCGDFNGTTLNGHLYGFTTDPTGSTITALGSPCTQTFRSTTTNLNHEMMQAVRVDYDITINDQLSGRFWWDRGEQPTYTDPINSIFNSGSNQPANAGQLTETHTFSPNLVNQFILGAFTYSAIFGPFNQAATLAAFPTTTGVAQGTNECYLLDGNLNCMGGETYRYPQGRIVGQYQVVDDVSWTKGAHNFKFGVNYRGINFEDYGPAANHSGDLRISSITDFVNGVLSSGGGSTLRQQYATNDHYNITNYSVGFYGQDQWSVKPNLKITAALRLDRNGNEQCPSGCFVRFGGTGDFVTGISHDPNTPYNQSVLTGQSSMFNSLQRIVWEPRAGFAWTPGGRNTVIRGGVGLFSDLYPAQISTNYLSNPPNTSLWNIVGIACTAPCTSDNLPIAPGVAGGAFAQAAGNNAALTTGFATGQTYTAIKAANPTFKGPTFYYTAPHITNPTYTEWNLEVQHGFTKWLSASLNYVGNRGLDEMLLINGMNAYSKPTTVKQPACAPTPCTQPPPFSLNIPFGNLAATPTDPRFTQITQVTNGGFSSYNGLTAGVKITAYKGLTTMLSYTWSHALDAMSNGGFDQYSTNQLGDSLRFQVDPTNTRLNYGNSDYDFRHVFNVNYVWQLPYFASNRWVGGWTISGVFFVRSGEPYSVLNSGLGSHLGNYTGPAGAYVTADFLGGPTPSCGVSRDQVNSPFNCLTVSQFAPASPSCTAATLAAATACAATSQHDFGNIGRNQFRGPGYFDTDLTIKKSFRILKREDSPRFIMGANAYNILNHRNFGNPDSNIADGAGTFGTIQNTVTPASSPYGNFQGAAVSGRILQLEMQVKF